MLEHISLAFNIKDMHCVMLLYALLFILYVVGIFVVLIDRVDSIYEEFGKQAVCQYGKSITRIQWCSMV